MLRTRDWQPPEDASPGTSTVAELVDLLHGRRVAVLTGAGCSTESGIPDYRGPETARRSRNPIQYREFVRSAEARQRYWARAVLGWQRFSRARPNAAHRAIAALEQHGLTTGLVTQNVDRLHHAAGSSNVVELHGALAEVACLDCGAVVPRDSVQQRLTQLNPGWTERVVEIAPDGDAELPREAALSFRVAACERCHGPLKPHVVFFGESVPKPRVHAAFDMVDRAEALLVAGSSLAVYSGYRFVRRAAESGKPIGIVNLGASRGDAFASVRVHGRAGTVLPQLVSALSAAS